MTDEQLKAITEILRLVECMSDDYRERNFGDAESWIRHISQQYSKFTEMYDQTPWELCNYLKETVTEN